MGNLIWEWAWVDRALISVAKAAKRVCIAVDEHLHWLPGILVASAGHYHSRNVDAPAVTFGNANLSLAYRTCNRFRLVGHGYSSVTTMDRYSGAP